MTGTEGFEGSGSAPSNQREALCPLKYKEDSAGDQLARSVVLVIIALVRIVHMARSAVVLMLVALVRVMHMTGVPFTLMVVVLMVIALMRIVDMAGTAVMLVLVAFVDIVWHCRSPSARFACGTLAQK